MGTSVSGKLPECERVSVVIPFRGRDHLDGLRKCIQSLREESVPCYIVLVEQDREPFFREEMEPLVDRYQFTYSGVPFNRGWAANCGVVISPDELVMVHDCDALLPGDYIRGSIQLLGSDDLVIAWGRALFLDEESSQRYPDGPRVIASVASNVWALGLTLLVRRSFYLDIGGMDERFEGWGCEDEVLFTKAKKLGRAKKAEVNDGPVLLHHYHKPAVKIDDYYGANLKMRSEYYKWSDQEIRQKVEELGSIGNPWKHQVRRIL